MRNAHPTRQSGWRTARRPGSRRCGVLGESPGGNLAVEVGEAEVHQHDVRLVGARDIDSLLGCRGNDRSHARLLEHVPGEPGVSLVVVND